MTGNKVKRNRNDMPGRRLQINRDAITAVLAVVFFYALLQCFGITCPIKWVTGISCAGCGMTRAWLALLRLDFAQAFYYHPLFWLPPVAIVLIYLNSKKNIKFYKISMLLIIGLSAIVYLYRMLWGSDDIVVFRPGDGVLWRVIHLLI